MDGNESSYEGGQGYAPAMEQGQSYAPTTEPNQGYAPAQQPQQEEWHSPYNASDWRYTLSSDPEVQRVAGKFKTTEDITKAYAGLESLLGKRIEDYTGQDAQTFARLVANNDSIPQSPEEYQLDFSRVGCNMDDEEVSLAQNMFSKAKLSAQQAQILGEEWNAQNQQMAQYVDELKQSSRAEVQQQWGRDFDTAYNNGVQAASILMECNPERAAELLRDADMAPEFLRLINNLGAFSMDTGSIGYGNLTPTDAGVRLEQQKANPDLLRAMMNPNDPNHKRATQEFRYLADLKYRQ